MTFRCAVLGERQVLASWDRFRRHEVGIILDPYWRCELHLRCSITNGKRET